MKAKEKKSPLKAEPLRNPGQSLDEEIIDEKWREHLTSIGDRTTWKAQITDEVEAVKQEILRVQTRFDNLQAAVIGKVEEYGTSVKDIGTEMKALEKVLEKILSPLTKSVKDLQVVSERLSTKRAPRRTTKRKTTRKKRKTTKRKTTKKKK